MENPRMAAGQRLRLIREQQNLTIREVETASMRLAEKYENEDYFIPLSRLSDVETKGVVPNIYKLYSLAAIYRVGFLELVALYGLDPDNAAFETNLVPRPRTHTIPGRLALRAVDIPAKLDPAFNLAKTSNLGRMIEKWGALPFAYLQQLAGGEFTY